MIFGCGSRRSAIVTRMFPGLRSRWMIPFWCACCTPSHTLAKISSRDSVSSLFLCKLYRAVFFQFLAIVFDLICLDLVTEKPLWEKTFERGCDRMSIAPDGTAIYLPSLEKDHWKVVDPISGDEIARVSPRSGSHNTVYGRDGKHAYLAGLRSPLLTVAETKGHTAVRTIGPFGDNIRPFTVNAEQTLCFVNVNNLLGFERSRKVRPSWTCVAASASLNRVF